MAIQQNASAPYVDLPNATDFHDLSQAGNGLPDDVKSKLWSALVTRDAQEKNIFRDFKGDEGGNKPITTKRDLSAGGSDYVTFTTTTPIRGQGVIGEQQLKGNTDRLRFGSFGVQVDLIRHAVSYTQILKLLRFTGQTVDQLSAEVMADWAARKEQDDCMVTLRNSALEVAENGGGPNVVSVLGKQFLGDADPSDINNEGDTISTDFLEVTKQRLIGQGAKPMSLDTDLSGADIPQYLFFGGDSVVRPLKADTTYEDALIYAQNRGNDNPNFKGTYPVWDNNMIHIHNLVIDTAQGRQGSPLSPRAYLGGDIPSIHIDALWNIRGGGAAYGASDEELDYFANFTGFPWLLITTDIMTPPTPVQNAQKHYMTAYDLNTGNFQVFEYTRACFNNYLKGNTVEEAKLVGHGGRNDTTALTSGNASEIKAGAIIYQSNKNGIPLEFGLHMGANALYYAMGSLENEPIYHYDDFANASNQAHLTATGVQSVRGLATYKDTIGRTPNYLLTVQTAVIPGVHLS